MATQGNSDGSIVIDTALDTKGFDKGSNELLNAIRSLTKEITRVGKLIETTFTGYEKSVTGSDTKVKQLESTIADLEAKVNSLKATIADLQSQIKVAGDQQIADPKSLTETSNAAREAETQVTELENRIRELENTANQQVKIVDADDISGAATAANDAEKEIAELKEHIRELENVTAELQAKLNEVNSQDIQPSFTMDKPKQSVSSLEKDITKLGTTVNDLSRTAEAAIDGDAKAMEQFETKAEQTQSTIDELRQRLDAFGNTEIQTDDYKWVQAEIEKTEKALDRLYSRETKMSDLGDTNTKAWTSLQYDIQQTEAKLNDLMATRQMFENSGSVTISGFDTQQYTQYSNAITEIENKLAGMQNEVNAAFAPPHVESWNQMVTLSSAIRDAFNSAFGSIRNGALMVGTAIRHPLQTINRFLGTVITNAARAAGTLARMAGTAIISGLQRIATAALNAARNLLRMVSNAIISGLRNLAAAARDAARSLVRMAARTITNGFKKLSSYIKSAAGAMLSFGKNSNKTHLGLKSGLSTLLKYTLGIQSLYMLFTKLKEAVKKGFENLAQFSDKTNKSISDIMSALTKFKNNLAAALDPVLQVISPIIVKFIGLINDAVSKIAEFFAAMSGQKTFIKAKDVQEDYAASLDKTKDKTEDVAEATKEVKNQLAGFDDLEILSDSSTSTKNETDTDASTGTSPKDMFEEVPVSSEMLSFAEKVKELFKQVTEKVTEFFDKCKDFIKQIKDLFLKGDYEGIGELIGESINKLFQKIKDVVSWDNVGDTITKFVTMICDAFNGLVHSIDWDLIGSTFAEGINTLLHTINLFLTQIDWAAIGTAFGEGLSALVRDIDWELLSDNIVK